MRDQDLCNKIEENLISYLAYHSPQTGFAIGPSYFFLIGGSVLYSPNGHFSGDNISYIYQGNDFAIQGSFDENQLLKDGQKVNFDLNECNENGMLTLKFSDPVEPEVIYHYQPPDHANPGDQPTVADELGVENIVVELINDFEVHIASIL